VRTQAGQHTDLLPPKKWRRRRSTTVAASCRFNCQAKRSRDARIRVLAREIGEGFLHPGLVPLAGERVDIDCEVVKRMRVLGPWSILQFERLGW
jgi:hypothetical protein